MYETREERDALFRFTGKYTEMDLLNKEATGFGWAVLVQDNFENNRLKVVKLPNREAATRELLAEAEILSKIAQYLRHPNLIALGSVDRYVIEWNGRKEERWFIVLQFGGDNLRKRLGRLGMRSLAGRDTYVYRNGTPLPVDEVLQIAIQVTDGLRALHDFEEAPGQHIVHRDIKPENILIDKEGTVRLTDFGISKVVERITQSVSVAGTAPYLAPEYSRGRISAASDIYSLGIVLYEMATGRFPFTQPDDRFYQMPDPPHQLNPQIPAGLSDVILRALWWDPKAGRGEEEAQRYKRAAEMLQDLRRCYSRLHPVPPQFVPLRDRVAAAHLYRDQETAADVRIFLYETARAGHCASRLASTVALDDGRILSPKQTFESEGMIGVVVPPVPCPTGEETKSYVPYPATRAEAPASAPSPPIAMVQREAIYPFTARLVILLRQLERLHRLGIYHGFLSPLNVYWDQDGWVIDQVWLGPLVGVASAESVFSRTEVAPGFLAPEVLRWEAPPTLGSDIYGVGAILYGRLTGTPPMEPAALAITKGQPPPPFRAGAALRDRAPTITRRLEGIVVKALQTDPAQRHRSVEELDRELSACRWPDDMIATLIADARDLRAQGKLLEAYSALDEAQRLEPGAPDVHHARAEIFFLEGEFKWALKENQKALDIEATGATCHLHGQCLAALGRYEDAAQCHRLGLEKDDSSRGRHLLAQCLDKIGQHQMALAEYQQAVRIAEFVEKDPARVELIKSDLSGLLSRLES